MLDTSSLQYNVVMFVVVVCYLPVDLSLRCEENLQADATIMTL